MKPEVMSLNRRSFLRIAALSATAAASACGPVRQLLDRDRVSPPAGALLSEHQVRVLDRLCYGISPVEINKVAETGLHAWIEEQLADDQLPELDLRWRLRNCEVLNKQTDAIEGAYKQAEVIRQLRAGTLLRQTYSRRQVYEMLVEFWNDHFNISVEKGPGWALKVVDDRKVIRACALGLFSELLGASAHSPAMLYYLDNQANHRDAPNENYARELMELHTLGVDGGYTQADIYELARCLTGWTVKDHFWRGRFTFDSERHDEGWKNVLGLAVEPGGEQEVELILDHLSHHPATAQHLSVKLVRRFLCDDPLRDQPEWVGRLQSVYLHTSGHIRAMRRKLFLDGLAKDATLLGVKLKRPVDFVVSALRVTGAGTDGGAALHQFLTRMGQATFAWPTPDGPPDIAQAWQFNLAPRWDFSLRLLSGMVEGSAVGENILENVMGAGSAKASFERAGSLVLGRRFTTELSSELFEVLRATQDLDDELKARAVIAGLLASPAFQYR